MATDKVLTLRTFLQTASGAVSFLAAPGFQSYAPQSGQILGIPKQLYVTFEVDVKAARYAEAKASKEFEVLQAAKLQEMRMWRCCGSVPLP